MDDKLQNSLRSLIDQVKQAISDKPKEQKIDWFERGKDIANVIAAIAIPVVIAVTGHFVNLTLQTRSTQGKMVELAIGILTSEPRDTEENKQIRGWAIDVIQKYSGVQITEKARQGLQENSLPTRELLESFGVSQENLKEITTERRQEIGKANKLREEILKATDPKLRSQITIEFFPRGGEVNTEIVTAALLTLGFNFKIKDPFITGVSTNSIWFGDRVPIKDVKLVAYTLIRAGIRIKVIRPFRSASGSQVHLIQVGSDVEYQSKKPLTVDEIHKSNRFVR